MIVMTSSSDPLKTISSLYRGPGGAAAIIRNGQLLTQHVWGYADLDRRIPMTSTTHFPICSISKQMLCLVIASLEQTPTPSMAQSPRSSTASLDEQLTNELHRLLPNLPIHKDSELTVHHLANMQSGLRDYWAMTVLWGAKPDDPFSLAHDAPHALELTKSYHFEPGTEMSYSNINFHILARAVENVAGQSLGQLLAERVFKPAGMKTAALAPNTAAPPLPIVGYEGSEKTGFQPAVNRIEWAGDAGVVASLEDMISYEIWLEATYAEEGSLYNAIAAPQKYKDGKPAAYGHGLVHMKLAGKDTIGHSGGLRGFRLQRLHVPEEHLSVVVLYVPLFPQPHHHNSNPLTTHPQIQPRKPRRRSSRKHPQTPLPLPHFLTLHPPNQTRHRMERQLPRPDNPTPPPSRRYRHQRTIHLYRRRA